MKTIAFLLLLAPVLGAQSEGDLRAFFEGKRVRVKIDMPATHEGVDCYFGKRPPLNFKDYSTRVRRFGVALRNGDEVMITSVKVKSKNIEFQLGGGGYGVFGDDSGYVVPRSVPKSNREKDLERDLKNETDPDRRERMQRELSRLRDRRQREEQSERDEAARLTEIKQQEVAQKRLDAGSRFNLWYPERYLKESIPTPRDVMALLGEWVDFGALGGGQ
jgi:hypothetical protein